MAVWFATLFGLGCLVLPPVLLERAADASRIATLVPAAAPPLGLTAHILLSCAAGMFGALLGFAIAQRVAAAHNDPRPATAEVPPRARQPKRESRRPILTIEELGEAPIAPTVIAEPEFEQAAPPPGRKRRLALDDEPLAVAPQSESFPWADEHPLMPSAQTLAERTTVLHTVPEPQREPFAAHPAPGAHDSAPESPIESASVPALEPLSPAVDGEPATAQPAPADPPERAPQQRPRELVDPLRALLAGQAMPVDRVGGPLEKLGVVQLAERLGRSLQRRGDAGRPPASLAARLQEPPSEEPVAPAPRFDPPSAEPIMPPSASTAVPAALRPFAPELEEFGEDEEADESMTAAGYSSLLSINGVPSAPETGGRAFDAPPEAAAQGKTRLDPAETERALRSALATLQRMSGAA